MAGSATSHPDRSMTASVQSADGYGALMYLGARLGAGHQLAPL